MQAHAAKSVGFEGILTLKNQGAGLIELDNVHDRIYFVKQKVGLDLSPIVIGQAVTAMIGFDVVSKGTYWLQYMDAVQHQGNGLQSGLQIANAKSALFAKASFKMATLAVAKLVAVYAAILLVIVTTDQSFRLINDSAETFFMGMIFIMTIHDTWDVKATEDLGNRWDKFFLAIAYKTWPDAFLRQLKTYQLNGRDSGLFTLPVLGSEYGMFNPIVMFSDELPLPIFYRYVLNRTNTYLRSARLHKEIFVMDPAKSQNQQAKQKRKHSRVESKIADDTQTILDKYKETYGIGSGIMNYFGSSETRESLIYGELVAACLQQKVGREHFEQLALKMPEFWKNLNMTSQHVIETFLLSICESFETYKVFEKPESIGRMTVFNPIFKDLLKGSDMSIFYQETGFEIKKFVVYRHKR